MPTLARKSVLALLCLQVLGGGSSWAADALDTSKLPRSAGAREIFASAPSTIYMAPAGVTQTADAVRGALRADGWQAFAPRAPVQAASPQMQVASFRKGSRALSVMIQAVPAQSNAASVSYTALTLRHDLPFPADATDIVFDSDNPALSLMTDGSLEQTLEFFRGELVARGWSRWTSKDGAQAAIDGPAGEITDHGAYSYYLRGDGQPMILLLQRKMDGRLWAEIKSVPAGLLTAATANKPLPESATQARAAARGTTASR